VLGVRVHRGIDLGMQIRVKLFSRLILGYVLLLMISK
jgi:hypothetical protein